MKFLHRVFFILLPLLHGTQLLSQSGINYAELLFDPATKITCILVGEVHASSPHDTTEMITRYAACPHILNLLNNHNYILQLEFSSPLLFKEIVKRPFPIDNATTPDTVYQTEAAMKAFNKLSARADYAQKIITTSSRSNALLRCTQIYFDMTEDAVKLIKNIVKKQTFTKQEIEKINPPKKPGIKYLDFLFFDNNFQQILSNKNIDIAGLQNK